MFIKFSNKSDDVKKKLYLCKKFFSLPYCVMVAQQILVLYVWVRVLVGQQKRVKFYDMKKVIVYCMLLITSVSANCQSYYYVFLADKNKVEFNPYAYFDQKAIERRVANGISLYDSSDFPVNQNYINQIADLSDEYVGESRWFNMVMIAASDENIAAIRNFPFVKNIVQISDNLNMQLAEYQKNTSRHSALDAKSPANNAFNGEIAGQACNDERIGNFDVDDFLEKNKLSNQLISLQGEYFVKNNINGKGVRIAVFDGGFPQVNTHEAFEHLRKNNQIVKTWNFPRKKEDVYGWNSHGTMVLSCIAGIKKDGTMLGLATGAEFLLARTEVEAEPKKEEFWWLQAVEWADKNGANVINSSLGYGIDRHYFEELDGKTTIVTKAANMAASKGILVCNSAGNEGSDRKWLKIIAPADADSILTVGGIKASLTHFSRINFSSYGPTADGRMKPNVVAFGYANVASPSKNYYKSVHGTSFSSPLIAGFVACAWQTNRNLTAMELKTEIEKSASLYPYFDYAYGYGIPQASYFTENQKPEIEKTFTITSNDTAIIITPIADKLDFLKINYLFYNVQEENGTLDYYTQIDLYQYYTMRGSENYDIVIKKDSTLNNKTLNVFLNGYFESYKIEETERYDAKYTFLYARSRGSRLISVNVQNQKTSKWGYKAKHFMTGYMAYSMFLPLPAKVWGHHYNYAKTHRFDIGFRYKYNVNKWYAIGGNLEYGVTKIHHKAGDENFLWAYYGYELYWDIFHDLTSNKIVCHKFNLEFFQRFNLGTTSFGNIYFDFGIYGGITASSKGKLLWNIKEDNYMIEEIYKIEPPLLMDIFTCGIKARLGYGCFALFTQFDTDFFLYRTVGVGIELSIPY